jgi:hypothetical protein
LGRRLYIVFGVKYFLFAQKCRRFGVFSRQPRHAGENALWGPGGAPLHICRGTISGVFSCRRPHNSAFFVPISRKKSCRLGSDIFSLCSQTEKTQNELAACQSQRFFS